MVDRRLGGDTTVAFIIDQGSRASKTPVVLKQVSGPAATAFAHVTLHRHDLAAATRFLDELDELAADTDDPPMVLSSVRVNRGKSV